MGTRHLSDELPSLLTGDASREVVLEAADHLRTCVDCQQELVWTVVAHSSLTSAHRFAPEIVAAPEDDDAEPADERPLPDLSALFESVRAEAEADTGTAAPRRHRRRLVAVAAAAAVLVGGGVTWATVGGNDSPTGPGTTVALANTGSGPGARVVVTGEKMRLDAASLPPLTAGKQYEVWLADGSQLQGIGFLKQDRSAELSVPQSLMARYDTIAVSVQNEGQTQFSGRVVLRGTYE